MQTNALYVSFSELCGIQVERQLLVNIPKLRKSLSFL